MTNSADCTSRCDFNTQTMINGNNRQVCLTCGMLGEWYRPDGTHDFAANILQGAVSRIRRELNKRGIDIRDTGPQPDA